MKSKRFVLHAVAGAALALAATASHAVALVGLTAGGQIASLDTNNLGATTATAISGLAAGDSLVGIGTRPRDGSVYGISLSNNIYTVNAATGAASFVSALSMAIVDATRGYGIAFNPSADFAGGSSLRFVDSTGSNFAINADTGTVTVAGGLGASGYTGVGYTNAALLPGAAPASTSLYYLNSGNGTLALATSNFNMPTLTTVGSLGVGGFNGSTGFDVLADGSAYAALNVGSSSSTGIYSVNLGTGAASLIGNYGGTLTGLTVAPIPEPETYALMLAGLAATGFMAKRRRKRA